MNSCIINIIVWILIIAFCVFFVSVTNLFFGTFTYRVLYTKLVHEDIYAVLSVERLLTEQRCVECGI